jgi:3-deoxy-D-manno-octulosonic-acid transferase
MGLAYRAAACLLHRLPYPDGPLARSLAGRRGAAARWRAWAAASRGDGALIWAHAASAGEAQALLPVVARLRAGGRGLRAILTHTSPSVSRQAPWPEFHHIDYLPLDEPGPMATVLDALGPALLLFGRGDLWPELVSAAASRGIGIAVAGAMVRPRSLRLRPPARWTLRPMHRLIAWVGAASGADAARWRRLGVPPARVSVTGDPRHDRVLERIPDLRAAALWRAAAPATDRLTLVAGSVEPGDDELLAETARRTSAAWRWLVVPHVPDERRIGRIEAAFRRRGVVTARWDGSSPPSAATAVILIRQGLLADLYWTADGAWVGGGFRRGRLHAVAEAAAAAVPVAAGPFLATVRDGTLLERSGGAVPVSDAGSLVTVLDGWAASAARRWDDGLAARAALETGAADRTVDALRALWRPTAPGSTF